MFPLGQKCISEGPKRFYAGWLSRTNSSSILCSKEPTDDVCKLVEKQQTVWKT